MASIAYNAGKKLFHTGLLNWTSNGSGGPVDGSDTAFKCRLIATGYNEAEAHGLLVGLTFADTTHFPSASVATAVNLDGYADQNIVVQDIVQNAGSLELQADSVAFGALGGSGGGANNLTLIGMVIMQNNTPGADSDQIPVFYIEFQNQLVTNGGNVTVNFASPMVTVS